MKQPGRIPHTQSGGGESGSKAFAGICVGTGLLALAFWAGACKSIETSHQGAAGEQSSVGAQGKAVPAADRRFIRAATDYLSSANTDGTRLAVVWAGASDGTSTLEDCRDASRRAIVEESARYSAYRAARGSVPPAFADVDRHIAEVHQVSLGGLKTVMSYWTNGNLESITRGTDQYKAAALEMNSTISELSSVVSHEAR
ncbi:MAG TPA: hypothetical protein VMD29_03870 [Terracidiphilus sp.]|nr:hypothetical protein [Terracidiphilus sp.]